MAAFAVGGPLAVALASLLGYVLAGSAMRPVEAMRRRAAAGDEQLPLPAAHDEIRRLGETLNALLARLRSSLERERRFVADASHELRTPLAVLKTELEAGLRGPDKDAAISAAIEECRPALAARRGPARARPVGGGRAAGPARDAACAAAARGCARPLRRPRDPCRPRHRRRGRRRHGRRRPAAAATGARQPGRQRAPPRRRRRGRARASRGRWRRAGGLRRRRRLPARHRRPRVRALRPRRRARTRGGTGLGLAIVRAIAEAHGGRATLEGSTVRVWMPSQGQLSGAPHDPQS